MSPTAPADQHVRDRIARTGLTETLFVDAGAGSGKTSQLVERVVNLVLEHDTDLSAIAAITFSEAAARELQDRIRVRFEEEHHAATEVDRRARCERALVEADSAAITTLHGFALRLLTEHSIAAGLPPRVEVLDEVSSALAAERRWRHFADQLHADPRHRRALHLARILGVAIEPSYERQPSLRDVATQLDDAWDRIGGAAASPLPDLDDPSLLSSDRLRAAAASALAGLDECSSDDDLLRVNTLRMLSDLESLLELHDPVDLLAELLSRGEWKGGSVGQKGNWPDVSAARARFAEVVARRNELVERASDGVLRYLGAVLCQDVLRAARARQQDGRLEFHDLLVLATELLRTKGAVRERLHDRYRHLLLDEFQDTDPLQIELATLIATDTGGADVGLEDSWRDLLPGAGRLFFVGDPKQSIYRFRRADISLYLDARRHFGGDDPCVLSTNFRTVEPIVGWVNTLFGQLMGDGVAEAQPAYEPLRHSREASDADHRPVILGGPLDASADELREVEAETVAAAICDIWRHPDAWPVWEGGWRPARLDDVAILIPARTSLPFLRRALDRSNIPYRLDTGSLVYASQEIRDLLAVLKAVDDPSDQRWLVAALRSPLYACSDVDLFEFRTAGGRWDVAVDPPETLPTDHPVVTAMAHLRELSALRWWSTPSTLLRRVIADRHALMLGFGHDRPTDVWRRLRFVVDHAQLFEETVGGSLRNFLDWADLQQSDRARVHEPLLPETDLDCVRIMTMHGAKGLEFPITIVSGTTTRMASPRRGPRVLWSDGTPEFAMNSSRATLDFDRRSNIEDTMDEHEKLRLLYVGCTRARDHLVVSCTHKPGSNTYARRIWDEMGGEGARRDDSFEEPTPIERQPRRPDDDVDDGAPETDGSERRRWILERAALQRESSRIRTWSATSIARAADPPHPPPVGPDTRFDVDSDPDTDVLGEDDDVPTATRGRSGTAIGRAVHGSLELTDLTDPGDVDSRAAFQAELEGIGPESALVATMVRSALASPAVQLARVNPHHKELYVAAPVGEAMIEGYVDLVVESADGVVVVDWKTDDVSSPGAVERALARYELQGAAYAIALERATGSTVTDVRFVFCGVTPAVEVSVSDLEAAKDRVVAVLALERAPHPPTDNTGS